MKHSWALLGLILIATPAAAQSPHGDMEADCGACHSSDTWSEVEIPEDFDHDEFDFLARSPSLAGVLPVPPGSRLRRSLFDDKPALVIGLHILLVGVFRHAVNLPVNSQFQWIRILPALSLRYSAQRKLRHFGSWV